jgi:hypothetical protein
MIRAVVWCFLGVFCSSSVAEGRPPPPALRPPTRRRSRFPPAAECRPHGARRHARPRNVVLLGPGRLPGETPGRPPAAAVAEAPPAGDLHSAACLICSLPGPPGASSRAAPTPLPRRCPHAPLSPPPPNPGLPDQDGAGGARARQHGSVPNGQGGAPRREGARAKVQIRPEARQPGGHCDRVGHRGGQGARLGRAPRGAAFAASDRGACFARLASPHPTPTPPLYHPQVDGKYAHMAAAAAATASKAGAADAAWDD